MSRSYKKNLYVRDNQRGGAKKAKREAASRIRNIPIDEDNDVLAGKSSRFKKVNKDSYDIHDYSWLWTEEDARETYRLLQEKAKDGLLNVAETAILKKYPTEKKYLSLFWAKHFRK